MRNENALKGRGDCERERSRVRSEIFGTYWDDSRIHYRGRVIL